MFAAGERRQMHCAQAGRALKSEASNHAPRRGSRMRAKDGTVRQDVRPYGHGSGASRGDRGRRGSPPGASTAEEGLDAANGEKSERVRRGILDATLACFAEHGWSGTSMSVIAR